MCKKQFICISPTVFTYIKFYHQSLLLLLWFLDPTKTLSQLLQMTTYHHGNATDQKGQRGDSQFQLDVDYHKDITMNHSIALLVRRADNLQFTYEIRS